MVPFFTSPTPQIILVPPASIPPIKILKRLPILTLLEISLVPVYNILPLLAMGNSWPLRGRVQRVQKVQRGRLTAPTEPRVLKVLRFDGPLARGLWYRPSGDEYIAACRQRKPYNRASPDGNAPLLPTASPPKGWQRNWIRRGAQRPENPVTCFPVEKGGGVSHQKGGERSEHIYSSPSGDTITLIGEADVKPENLRG